MSTAGASFVRAARGSDAPVLAGIQVACWRADLSGVVPANLLDQLTSEEALGQWEQRWREAIISPPTSRHRVFVAVGAADSGTSVAHRPPSTAVGGPPTAVEGAAGTVEPVAFASAGPATDADRWPATDGQLYELRVLPELADEGHASRLLHAVADTLAEDGFRTLSTWALEADTGYLEFLTSAGWQPDGARAELEAGNSVPVMRLGTAIGEYGGEQT